MRELSKEMEKAGIIDEMMEEAFEDMDSEDVEEESAAQVSLSCHVCACVCVCARAPLRSPFLARCLVLFRILVPCMPVYRSPNDLRAHALPRYQPYCKPTLTNCQSPASTQRIALMCGREIKGGRA